MYFGALICNLKKPQKYNWPSPLWNDIVYLVCIRLTFHFVTCLYYACHVTSISGRLFDVTIYTINLNLNFFVNALFVHVLSTDVISDP